MTRRHVPKVNPMFFPSGDHIGVSDWNVFRTRVVPPAAGATPRKALNTWDLNKTSPRAVIDGSYVSRSKCVNCAASPVSVLHDHKSNVPFAFAIL